MSRIKQNVMYSVGVIYLARKALSPFALKVYALIVASAALASMVSVPHVVANFMTAGLSGAGTFILSALISTTVSVQIMTALAAVFGALLIRDSLISRTRGVSY